jgi:serine incorporator 1/3
MLWVEEAVVEVYLWVADMAYLGFYVYQSLTIVDLSHRLNTFWRDQDSLLTMLLTTIFSWVITVSFLGLCYFLYLPFGSPALLLIYLTLGMAVVLTLMSLLFEGGSLMTGSLVGMYVGYLGFNLMRHVQGQEEKHWLLLCTGLEMLLACILIARTISSWSLSSESSDDISKPLVSTQKSEEEASFESREMIAFHALMLFAGCFFVTALRTISYQLGVDSAGFLWAKFGIQCATCLIYLWTLAAPSLFPDRDFSY